MGDEWVGEGGGWGGGKGEKPGSSKEKFSRERSETNYNYYG